ncbi:MAG: glycosyltransferase [Sphingobacteriales bacterium JAD_PAG50586_3]|nr:MAG: glycosyltransferase [Sphingobacteriales bacterium JAD_PAG50586_3]
MARAIFFGYFCSILLNSKMVDVPLVSVLMPVYNTAPFLAEAIQSILNQTYQNLELIIVNDGSTDNSEEVILSFNDKRIRYYPNAENKKIVYSRNKALELANGKYIAFLDSDDYSVPNRLEIQVDFLEKNMLFGFIGSNARFVNTRNEYSDNIISYQIGDDDIEIILLFKNFFCASTITFRRDAIGNLRFNPDFPVAEDYDFYLRILEKGWKATNLNQGTYLLPGS